MTIDYVTEALPITALNAAEHGSDHYPWTAVRGFVRPRSNWSAVRAADPIADERRRRMSGRRDGSVLVVYALLQWPWRRRVADHLHSFRRYGSRPYEYLNLAVPGLASAYARRRYDAVVWHNSVLSWLRWSPASQHGGLRARALQLRDVAPFHVALPQDEFLNSDSINEFLSEIGVRHVFSVAPPSEWPTIYDGLDPNTLASRVCSPATSTKPRRVGSTASSPRAASARSTSATARCRESRIWGAMPR